MKKVNYNLITPKSVSIPSKNSDNSVNSINPDISINSSVMAHKINKRQLKRYPTIMEIPIQEIPDKIPTSFSIKSIENHKYVIPNKDNQLDITIPETLVILSTTTSTQHLTFPVKINFQSRAIDTYIMIDSGATGSFIDHKFINQHNIPVIQKDAPVSLSVIDGRSISSGAVTHNTIPLNLKILDHEESMSLDVTHLGNYPIILGIPWLRLHNPQITWNNNSIKFNHKQDQLRSSLDDSNSSNNIKTLSFYDPDLKIFAIINQTILKPTESSSIPVEYKDFHDVFSKANSEKLPPHRPYDHQIPLLPDTQPPFGPIYSLSEIELKALRDYIKEHLDKGFIRPSSSPAGAPILFVKKKSGELRLCVDFRGLNKMTIKNRYPLPLINELLDRFKTAKYFTKIDLRGAYNLIRIAKGEEWKTAFRTRYGHFEYLVMPFGLCNAPASFQHFMNDVLSDCLDKFAVAYLDDILIFSENYSDHISHVREILERLRLNSLYAKLEKCEFHKNKIEFLGYIVSSNGIIMDSSKTDIIRDWPILTCVKDI